MPGQDFGIRTRFEIRIHWRAVRCVATGGLATIRPIHHAVVEIELQINWFRPAVEQQFDVRAIGRSLAFGHFNVRAEDAALISFLWAFFCPIKMSAPDIYANSNTPLL